MLSLQQGLHLWTPGYPQADASSCMKQIPVMPIQQCPDVLWPHATVQARPSHHNRHTIKRIYSPRCIKKIKNGMPPSWNLWLESWATSLHMWAAWGPWHNLHPTQTCLTPVICTGAVSWELLVNMLKGRHWQPSCIGTSNQEQASYWSDSLHPPKCIWACPSDLSREGDRPKTVRLNFSWEVATPKSRCLESL